jgi:predicted enzyme related to lactoylglutathione lyase
MPNKPSHHIWYELMTTEADAAARFYGDVVGWSVADAGQTDKGYRQWSVASQPVGGLMTIPDAAAKYGMRPMWAGYLCVDDVDASVTGIIAAGGGVSMPPNDISGVGRMTMVTDPQGAIFYIMAPLGAAPSPSFTPGRPGFGGWNELHTTDWRAAREFYGSQFGWGTSQEMDMGAMGTYLLFNTGGDAVGGMMNDPDYARPAWLYYFNVDDIGAAKSRVEAAGGEVRYAPHQVPTGEWVFEARDPQGARFALMGPNRT